MAWARGVFKSHRDALIKGGHSGVASAILMHFGAMGCRASGKFWTELSFR